MFVTARYLLGFANIFRIVAASSLIGGEMILFACPSV